MLLFSFLQATLVRAQPASDPKSQTATDDLTISLIGVEASDKALMLRYVIRNRGKADVWLCDIMDVGSMDFESYWADDPQTFRVRRRSHVLEWSVLRNPPLSRYVRLRAGEYRSESMLLPLPLRPQSVVASDKMIADAKYVDHVVLEIGYYDDSTSKVILQTVAKGEMSHTRDDFFVYHHSGPAVENERCLHLRVDSPRVACGADSSRPPGIDLGVCTSVRISYDPSMLAYFLPYSDQQDLLDSAEKQYLRSSKTVLVDDKKSVNDFARQIANGELCGLTAEGAKAHVTCYRADSTAISFDVYGDAVISSDMRPFYYAGFDTDGVPNLERLTPEIRPFILRVQCAQNLDRLRLRFRFYTRDTRQYPSPAEWCDVIVRDWRARGYVDEYIFGPFMCPSASEGKCHYAMNPACEPNSSADTVLLFETKAGWNQCGGPELFTFDNHDPKGGLVLLNDGEVKFIRTEEELKQLRWK